MLWQKHRRTAVGLSVNWQTHEQVYAKPVPRHIIKVRVNHIAQALVVLYFSKLNIAAAGVLHNVAYAGGAVVFKKIIAVVAVFFKVVPFQKIE